MPLPHSFIPGEIARSAEVNENFAYIMSILGQLSTPGRVKTATEFQMGARANVLFTGTHDSGAAANKFFQIGYNADFNLISTVWKFVRFINNEGASAIRLGPSKVEFWLTSKTTGDLNAQMAPFFKAVATETNPNADYIYVPISWSFQRYDGEARNIGDYRTMYTFLNTPATIYDGGSVKQATSHFDATDFGVPTHAKAVALSVEGTTGSSVARARFYMRRTSPSGRYGFTMAANAAARGNAWGVVPLGIDSYAHQFTIERTAPFTSLTVYLVGYYA